MRCVRKAVMKVIRVNDNVDIKRISSNRLNWIGANDWPTMVEAWDTDEWRLKSKIAKENKSKSQSGKHTGGTCRFLLTKIVMEIRIMKKQNDDLTKKMEEERVAAKAQKEADLMEWKKTLDDRFESFAQNYSPRNERPTESDPGPS
ncbi:hypothetical protein Tco_1219021 [Tanacetum coccineum]